MTININHTHPPEIFTDTLVQQLAPFVQEEARMAQEEAQQELAVVDGWPSPQTIADILEAATDAAFIGDRPTVLLLSTLLPDSPQTRSTQRRLSCLLKKCSRYPGPFQACLGIVTATKIEELRRKLISNAMSSYTFEGEVQKAVQLSLYLPAGKIRNNALLDSYVCNQGPDHIEGDVSIPLSLAGAMSPGYLQSYLMAEAASIKASEETYAQAIQIAEQIPDGFLKDSVYLEIARGNNVADDYEEVVHLLSTLPPSRGRNILYGHLLGELTRREGQQETANRIRELIPRGQTRDAALRDSALALAQAIRRDKYIRNYSVIRISTIVDLVESETTKRALCDELRSMLRRFPEHIRGL